MPATTRVLLVDESGDHSLKSIQDEYPVFVLAGVIADRDYALGPMEHEVRRFKRELFGTEEIILHTSDIVRQRNGFEMLVDRDFRARFFGGLNDLMRRLEYQVVACAIQKERHRDQYGAGAFDPYELSLHVLVERFCFEGGGTIVAEERDDHLNRELMRAWDRVRDRGTTYVPADRVRGSVSALKLRPKSANIAGLQVADLVASPIGRYVIGKPTREDWDIIQGKFRRDAAGGYEGRGLVVLPKGAK